MSSINSNSNPIFYKDPTGHFSLAGLAIAQDIRATLSNIQVDVGFSILDAAMDPESAANGPDFTLLGVAAMGGAGGKLIKLLSRKWKDAPDITFNPLRKGPLRDDVVRSFRSATYTQKVLKEPVVLYRVYGRNRKLGEYWSRNRPTGRLQNAMDSAILDEFGNSQANLVKIKVPEGQVIYEGVAARQISGVTTSGTGVTQDLLGGGNQVYLPNIDPSWIIN